MMYCPGFLRYAWLLEIDGDSVSLSSEAYREIVLSQLLRNHWGAQIPDKGKNHAND